jgi:cobalt-zinc-cadmium efflux system outer membrane protein
MRRLISLGLPVIIGLARAAGAQPASTRAIPDQMQVPVEEQKQPRHDRARTEQPRAPSVDHFVRLALEQSPSLLALRARYASAREQVAPAGSLPDPMVGVMYQSMGPPWRPMPPMSMAQVEVTQVLPGFGKRQARRVAAEADAEFRGADIGALRARLASDVRSTYARIYALDREREALEAADQLLGVLVGGVRGRYAAGVADQEALAKAELERSKLRAQLVDLGAERGILVAQLNQLAARPESIPLPALTSLPETSFDIAHLSERARDRSPELRLQRAAILAANRRREAAQTETRPNFLVGLAGGATTAGDPIFTLRFGVELPVWRSTKQDPLIRAARKDVEAAENEYRAIDFKIREEATRLIVRWKRDTDQIRLYREAIIPQADLTLRAAQNAYATGRADFSTVIEDFQRWLEAQTGLARREADKMMSWAELEALTSSDLEHRGLR